ncbi:MAG: hypothetical protein GY937_01925 [bacterium]|nr:hypothetical protein [bacterium]
MQKPDACRPLRRGCLGPVGDSGGPGPGRGVGTLRTAVTGIVLVVVLGAVGVLEGCAPETLEVRRAAAAQRGVEWLIANHDQMPHEWAYVIFPSLYKVLPDGDLVALTGVIGENASRRPILELPPDLDDPKLLRLLRLRPVVAELVRRKQMGEPWEGPTRQLQALLRRHEPTLWRRLESTQRVVLLHQFAKLGIETQLSVDAVRQGIQSRWQNGDSKKLLVDIQFMYGVTHVFFGASGEFSGYLDAADYELEIEILGAALRRYLSESVPERRAFLDLQAEIMAARKLVRLPENEDALAMTERLLAFQHEDGSWGEPGLNHEIHATYTAVLALLDYPPSFRELPSSWKRKGNE